MIDYATILSRKYEGSEWTLEGDDYSGLNWISDTEKPSKETLDNLWETVIAEMAEEKTAKTELKASAIAKLEALGLTEFEAKALLS
jgi:hypothetical protein